MRCGTDGRGNGSASVEEMSRKGQDLHQVLASGSSMLESMFRKLTLRMKP